MIQHIDGTKRVDTGALKIGDDWPGVFIRGDYAMFRARDARWAIENNDIDVMKSMLGRLATLFESCKV